MNLVCMCVVYSVLEWVSGLVSVIIFLVGVVNVELYVRFDDRLSVLFVSVFLSCVCMLVILLLVVVWLRWFIWLLCSVVWLMSVVMFMVGCVLFMVVM